MVRAIFLTRVISFLLASSAHFSLSPRRLSELPSPGSCRSSPGRCCARISGVSCGPETLGEASEWPGDYSAPLRVYIKAIIHLSREKTSSRKGGTGLHQIDSDIQSILFLKLFQHPLKAYSLFALYTHSLAFPLSCSPIFSFPKTNPLA